MAVSSAVQQALNVVLLGPPGAGKGTQSERIASRLGVPKVSTGEMLRRAVQEGTAPGGTARQAIDAGNLVGDDAVICIVKERLTSPDAWAGFVLDGFPRTVIQAGALDDLVAKRGALVVLDIVVPEDVLVHRLASRRICSRRAPQPEHQTRVSAHASPGSGSSSARSRARPRLMRIDTANGVLRL